MSSNRAPSKIADMQPTPASQGLPTRIQYAAGPPRSSSGRVIQDCAVAAPSASRRSLQCPPTYPQDPKHSTIDFSIAPLLKSVAEWQKAPPVNANGKLAKIVYAMSSNADQEMAYHYIPEEVVHLTDWHPFVHASRYRRRALSMEWEGAEHHAHSATSEGEYCMVEAHAVPFYLQHIFADRYGLFEVVTVPLRLLEILLTQQLKWRKQQEQEPNSTFRDYLRSTHQARTERVVGHDEKEKLENEFEAVMTLHTHLHECEVCVVPSVLLMNKSRIANEWYDMLRALEPHFDLEVFPRIDVEQKMENKDLYFTALMRSPRRYIPLDMRQTSAFVPSSSSSVSRSARDKQLWRGSVPFVHCRSNGITCPTIVIPSWDALVEYQEAHPTDSPDEHLKRFVRDMVDLLQEEVTADGWQVDPGEWVFKGLNSTRSNVMRQLKSIDQMAMYMNEAAAEGMKLCAPQPGFLVQPFMHGLRWESRTYFNRGEFQFSLMSDQPPSHRPGANRPSAFNTVEVRGHNRISQSEFGYAQAQMVDFCVHILKECEHHCKLVSSSGILRVDLGAEFLYCSEGVTETQLRHKQRNALLWHITGAGFIVRFFLNEVTSSLDINWFSQQTNYPIVYEAAYVTSQMLLELIAARPSVKRDRTIHGIYLLDPSRPEPALPDGEVQRVKGHVCEFQCGERIAEYHRQVAADKEQRREAKRVSRLERLKSQRRQNPKLILSDDQESDNDGEVVFLGHRPLRQHTSRPSQTPSRLRQTRSRSRNDDEDEHKAQPRRRSDAMRDDGTNGSTSSHDQDSDPSYSDSDRSATDGDDDEASSNAEEDDEVKEQPPPRASAASSSSSHRLNGKPPSAGRHSSSSRPPPPGHLCRLPRKDAAGITCLSSDSDESEDLTIADDVTDAERKKLRREHYAKKQREKGIKEEIDADGDELM